MASCISASVHYDSPYNQVNLDEVFERTEESLRIYGISKEQEKYALKLMTTYRRRRQNLYYSFLKNYDVLLKHPDAPAAKIKSLRETLEKINRDYNIP